jgi:hypothetical protein
MVEFYKCILLRMLDSGSLTSREERRLRVFENRVLRRIFGPKRDEPPGEWRMVETILLFVTVAMVSHYQSAVDWIVSTVTITVVVC